eukprot:GFKZ01004191.1.p1 GENE.GFKZ01004191.1~~GFKZ01004191.1.p1  ORF type:complete len:738 (-),score=99.26 GFKZ01004191.1:1840-4053(-)
MVDPSGSSIFRATPSSTQPFTGALRDHKSPLWTEVAAICTSNQPAQDRPPFFSSNRATYQIALPPILRPLDSLLAEPGPISHAQSCISDSLAQLSLIESSLDSVITDLEEHLSGLNATCHQLTSLRPQATHFLCQSEKLTDLINHVQIPDDLHAAICTANPHSPAFASALQTLSDKLGFISLPENSQAIACQHIQPNLRALLARALDRVNERLEHTFDLLQQPSSSFDILRNTLLCNQRHLIRFISNHADHPAHTLRTSNPALQQYLAIARSTLHHKTCEYTELLSEWAAVRQTSTHSPLHLVNIARGATEMFSAVFANTNASYSPEPAQSQPRVKKLELRDHARGSTNRKEEVELVLGRWIDAASAMDKPYVTEADLLMRQTREGPSLEELYRNAALFFVNMAGKELSFLETTFGDAAGSFVEDVVEKSGDAVVRIIEAEVTAARNRNEGVLGLIICLMLNRRFRCGIPTVQARDVRVSFLLNVERILQTNLLEDFDEQVKRLKEIFMMPSESVPRGGYDKQLLELGTLAADVLVVLSKGAEKVDAADITVLMERRLLSIMNLLVDNIDKLGRRLTDVTNRLKAKLHLGAEILSLFDFPQDLESPGGILTRLREPVLEQWSRASTAYGQHVAGQHNTEIVKAISALNCGQHDVVRAQLAQFRETLQAKFRSIHDSFKFLSKDGGVSRSLRSAAEQLAFEELARWNEKVARLVREHLSDELHLLVTRSAFVVASQSE